MRSRAGSPRILSWRIASPQRSLLAAPPLDKGNKDSWNEIGPNQQSHSPSVYSVYPTGFATNSAVMQERLPGMPTLIARWVQYCDY